MCHLCVCPRWDHVLWDSGAGSAGAAHVQTGAVARTLRPDWSEMVQEDQKSR